MALSIGGCGTSFRLACDTADSHFLNKEMLQFLPENGYFGAPFRGLRNLISPADSHFLNTGMLSSRMQNDTLALPIGGCASSFRLARDTADSHFLTTGMRPSPIQNA